MNYDLQYKKKYFNTSFAESKLNVINTTVFIKCYDKIFQYYFTLKFGDRFDLMKT